MVLPCKSVGEEIKLNKFVDFEIFEWSKGGKWVKGFAQVDSDKPAFEKARGGVLSFVTVEFEDQEVLPTGVVLRTGIWKGDGWV